MNLSTLPEITYNRTVDVSYTRSRLKDAFIGKNHFKNHLDSFSLIKHLLSI